MNDINEENSIKTLDTVNDFPHVGLMYFENSGENLLRFYNFRGRSPLFLLLISSSKLLTIFNRIFLEVCEKKLTFAPKAK